MMVIDDEDDNIQSRALDYYKTWISRPVYHLYQGLYETLYKQLHQF